VITSFNSKFYWTIWNCIFQCFVIKKLGNISTFPGSFLKAYHMGTQWSKYILIHKLVHTFTGFYLLYNHQAVCVLYPTTLNDYVIIYTNAAWREVPSLSLNVIPPLPPFVTWHGTMLQPQIPLPHGSCFLHLWIMDPGSQYNTTTIYEPWRNTIVTVGLKCFYWW
jgi:hypothetical protein